jgi:hypothetical protein
MELLPISKFEERRGGRGKRVVFLSWDKLTKTGGITVA